MDDAERRELLSAAQRRSFARGEVVFHEGDPADTLHLIESGRLAVRIGTPSGEVAMLNVLSPGGFFGELSLLHSASSRHRSATVVALEPATTLAISSAAFHRLCAKHPRIERLLVSMLATRIEQLSGRLVEALYVGLDRRIYRCLLELADIYSTDGQDPPWVIPFTQEHIADLVGGTRPSVNQVLQKLVAQQIVELGRGRVVVVDRVALQRKAG